MINNMTIYVFKSLFIFILVLNTAYAGTVTKDIPDTINKAERYLIYMHGISVEIYGSDSYSNIFDRFYENTKIAKKFSEHGFNVIAEVRKGGKSSLPKNYAQKVVDQVKELINAGVPAKNITVVGHSRGAFTALIASSHAFESDINYAILAGCALPTTHDIAGGDPRKGFEKFLYNRAELVNGRLLSLYDKSDEWFGSCEEVFDMADGIINKEVVLNTQEGHGVFYSPNPAWVDLVVKWANQETF